MSMKRVLLSFAAAIAALSFAACSPSAYILSLESRAPSESGLNLSGKSMSIVYLESENGSDTLFNNRAADALAYALEADYFSGEQGVKVYNLPKDPEGDYASRDTLSQYIMMLDTDVVMILDTPSLVPATAGSSGPSVYSKLYAYDSMNKEEEVLTFSAHTSVTSLEDTYKATSIGTSIAKPLKTQWKKEDYTVVYFDEYKWVNAVELADDMKWADAIEIWMELSRTNNAAKASSAKYNVALGCYLLEQYDLALEWLESSDKSYPLSLNQGLRSRIKEKMGK